MRSTIKILFSSFISLFWIVNTNANATVSIENLTVEELKKVVTYNPRGLFSCYVALEWLHYHHTKTINFPYRVDERELVLTFKEKLLKEQPQFTVNKDLGCSQGRNSRIELNNNYELTNFDFKVDYSKDVYLNFVLQFSYGGLLVSDTVFMKEIPLSLNELDFQKFHEQTMRAIQLSSDKGTFNPGKDVHLKRFVIYVAKQKEHAYKSSDTKTIIPSWKPEFANYSSQLENSFGNQSVLNKSENTSQKPTIDKAAAIQKSEQEKIIKAEIKKEVAVAQVENKAQLTQDKALHVVKKVDDDVQKALKKIPKKEKKKVELKPYLETVVVCTPPSERGSFKCYGPNGSFSGHPNQPKGYKTPEEVVTMNMKWSCPDQKRFASVNNHSIWGCGQGATGSVSSKDSSQGLPIPERATYYCKPKQIGCKNKSPMQAEN